METLEAPKVALPGSDDSEHVVCLCRPHYTYCGRYEESPPGNDEWDDDEACPECIQVLDSRPCGNCGCWSDQTCGMCDV